MKSVSTFITVCVLLATIVIAAIQVSPLNPQQGESNFSAERAMKYVSQIAKAPHPTGSEAHKQVRDYILKEAEALGYQTELHKTRFTTNSRTLQVAFVENILIRMKGSSSDVVEADTVQQVDSLMNEELKSTPSAIMVACHYDSRSNAAGAADDGAAVGAILELLRMFNEQQTTFQNDIIFLITDAEEIDLLGAQAFMEQHPWAKEVAVAFNFEARGGGGMSILFETSKDNQALMHHTAQAFQDAKQRGKFRAFGTSFANLVYQNMPNGTDASVFGAYGIPFLNFAFIGDHTHYHTPLDTPENLSEGSLQQHGNYMLSLLRYFGNLKDIKQKIGSKEDVIFFGFPSQNVNSSILVLDIIQEHLNWVVYGMSIFFILLLFVGLRFWSGKFAFGSFLGYLPFSLSVGGLATLLWAGILSTHSSYDWMPYGTTYFAFWYQVAFACIFVGLSLVIYSAFYKNKNAASVLLGALPYWIALCWLSVFSHEWIGIDLRPTAYLFIIPTLCMLVAWLYLLFRTKADYLNPFDTFVLVLLCVPTIYIFYPVLAIIPVALEEVYISSSFTLYGFAIMALLIGMLSLLLVPLMQLLVQGWRWSLALFLMILGIGMLFWGALESSFSAEQPKPNSLFAVFDSDQDTVTWLSYDPRPDEFTKQVLGKEPVRSATPYGLYSRGMRDRKDLFMINQSPDTLKSFAAPTLSVLSDSSLNDSTYLYTLKIQKARKGEWLQLYGESIQAIWNDTLRVAFRERDRRHNVSLWAVPDSGAVLNIETNEQNPTFILSEIKYGLTELDSLLTSRTSEMMAAPYPYSESVVVKKQYKILEEEN